MLLSRLREVGTDYFRLLVGADTTMGEEVTAPPARERELPTARQDRSRIRGLGQKVLRPPLRVCTALLRRTQLLTRL